MTNVVCNPSTQRPDPRYPYKTEWSDTGEIIYHVPVIADSADALITLNAKQNGGLRFISIGGGKPEPVVFIKTTDAAFAYNQRAYLNTMHSKESRYAKRHEFFEGSREDEEGETISRDENPILECHEQGYEETEVTDLRDRMVAYVNKRFPKNPMYGKVLEQYLKNGYGTRVIGEKLGIKERAARFFLDQAKPVAAEYYDRFGR
nr:hypothetical protein [Clostridia bacterium]